MHCRQIVPHLDGFLTGTLPRHQAAWVAQHIAGCESCREALACRRAASGPDPARDPADTAAAGTSSDHAAAAGWPAAAPQAAPPWHPVMRAMVSGVVAVSVFLFGYGLWQRFSGPVPPARQAAAPMPVQEQHQEVWRLVLPDGPAQMTGGAIRLPGEPQGTTLVEYVQGDGLLHIRLQVPAGIPRPWPLLYLCDGNQTLVPPAAQVRVMGTRGWELAARYPVAVGLVPPLYLKTIPLQQELVSWRSTGSHDTIAGQPRGCL